MVWSINWKKKAEGRVVGAAEELSLWEKKQGTIWSHCCVAKEAKGKNSINGKKERTKIDKA